MLDALLDLVLPRSCHGCGAPGATLCPPCRARLSRRPLGAWRPSPCPSGLPPVAALAAYDGPVKAMLLAHKEHGRLALTRPLGQAVAVVARPLVTGPLVLCPVPSARSAVRQRGYDHALRLAREAARALRPHHRVVARHLLQPVRRVADQAGLTAAQRVANLHGALRGLPHPPARVLLVDDVITTGASLQEAARALSEAGHLVVGAAVVGATHRHGAARFGVPLLPVREEG